MTRFWQCFRQANRWSQLSPSGTAPTARNQHTSVWSDVADGMYVFGGVGGRGLSVNGSSVRNTPRHSTASLRHTPQWHAFLRPPGVGRVEFAWQVWWGLLLWDKSFSWISWRHENVCETSCQRSTCLAPFLDIFLLCFHFYALVWRHM